MATPRAALLPILLLLAAVYSTKAENVDPPPVDYSCSTASDCAIKNMGNCCGEYPKCVNQDFTPDYEGLQEWCKEQGVGGFCGFESIDSCTCQEGVCVGYYSANSPEIEQFQDPATTGKPAEEFTAPSDTDMDEGPTGEEEITPNDNAVDEGPPFVDYSCNTGSDCAIKNVGNCCGAYPKCVNRDFTPDYEGLQEWCKEQGMGGVCGFESIDSCTCQEGVCVGYYSANSPEIEQFQDPPTTGTHGEEVTAPSDTDMEEGPTGEEETTFNDNDVAEGPPFVDYSCNTGSDCAIKNVGNCCGEYPKCVNRDFTPDYEGLQEWCKDQGMGGICGFESIDSCTCQEGVCVGYYSANSPETEDPPITTSNDNDNQQNANSFGNSNTVFTTSIDESNFNEGKSSAFSLGGLGWIMALFGSLLYL